MKPIHFAGVITGVTQANGMVQVTASCSLGKDKPQLTVALPITKEDCGGWATKIGERVVLSLACVQPAAPEAKAGLCRLGGLSPCMNPAACESQAACQNAKDAKRRIDAMVKANAGMEEPLFPPGVLELLAPMGPDIDEQRSTAEETPA